MILRNSVCLFCVKYVGEIAELCKNVFVLGNCGFERNLG